MGVLDKFLNIMKLDDGEDDFDDEISSMMTNMKMSMKRNQREVSSTDRKKK